MHPCTLKDLNQFYQEENWYSTKASIDKIESLFCLDKEKLSMELSESAQDKSHVVLDVKAIACSARECNKDKQKAIDYLHDASIVFYHNKGEFQPTEFDKPPIAQTMNKLDLKIDS